MRSLFACLLLSLTFQLSAEEQPNILFIVADDLNCAISPYSDETAITPHLDRIAQRGVVFERAYCQQSVCNPSRSSFLTGLRPQTVGVDDLRKSFRETAPNGTELITLPQHFKNHGYFCQNIGKLFHNMGETQDRQSWSIDEVLHAGTHAADTVYTNTPPHLRTEEIRKAPTTEAPDAPDTVYRDGQIANLSAAMLREHPADGQPFFLAVGFWRPHLPFVAPKRYWDLYDPDTIPIPTTSTEPAGVPEIAMHESREIKGYGTTPKDRPFTEKEIRHFRHGYYASISFMDAQIGKILDALEQGGHAEDTFIVFTSDHGFHIGEHALWGKTSNFELDARVPLIIADPSRPESHGTTTPALSELVDLFPTFADLAGLSADLPSNLEGKSLVPVLNAPTATVKDAAFSETPAPFYVPREKWRAWGYSVRTDRWRYTEWRSTKDDRIVAQELYDHQNDPEESVNVASDHAGVVAKHSQLIATQFDL